ncbi:unnamed protein product [Rotaria magnacalcarata]|uniref:Small ribosomal subunit protein eS24 n=1 Tax=Rotaria magnacalcarata TaxID=392030 RepID=A0A815KXL4_9BILA|nr:unnamed protein product [Rotaria magnacalcarata]CAF3859234.1 unnamed protein product [Rotaria magnacalcarata]CAF3860416.1 unnamed protein product [Rotaria magnacalcarata]CAF3861728.1 unnamed protein product [Rotaria magnacalcarata]
MHHSQKKEIRKTVAQLNKTTSDLVFHYGFNMNFDGGISIGLALIYDTLDFAEKVNHVIILYDKIMLNHRKQRNERKRKYNRGRLLLGNLNNNNNNNNNNVNVQNSSSSSDSESDDNNNVAQPNNNHNYGRRVEGPWIFGIAEPTEEGHEVRFFHVARRDAATLIPIIWKNVYPGTTI